MSSDWSSDIDISIQCHNCCKHDRAVLYMANTYHIDVMHWIDEHMGWVVDTRGHAYCPTCATELDIEWGIPE